MNTLKTEVQVANAQNVAITEDTLTVELRDGRTISVPLAWYPRLLHGTPEERSNWRFIGEGESIHWPDLDEDNRHHIPTFGYFNLVPLVGSRRRRVKGEPPSSGD
jgi:hypothetical protein